MKIKTKFNLFVTLFTLTFSGVILYLSYIIVLRGFVSVEQELAAKNLLQFEEAHKRELEEMNTKIADWAWWNDTYEYLQKQNEEYEENLLPTGLEGLKISGMLFYNTENVLVKQTGYDFAQSEPFEFSSELIQMFSQDPKLNFFSKDDDFLSGFIEDPKRGIYMFSTRPVLTSQKEGPRAGRIVFLRAFDKSVWERISTTVQLPYEYQSWEEATQKKWLEVTEKTNQEKPGLWFNIKNTRQIDAFYIVSDFAGKELGVSHFILPRNIYIHAEKNVALLTLVLSFMLILTAIFTYFMIRIFMIDKILFLNKEVKKVSSSEESIKNIKEFSGKDELAELSQSINSMLLSLQSSQELLKTGKENVHTYIDVVGVMVVVLNLEGRIVLMNKKAGEVLGVSPEKAVGEHWIKTYIDPAEQLTLERAFSQIITNKSALVSQYEHHENWIITKKQEKKLISWHNSLMKNEKGEIVALLSAGEDITEKKQQELEKEKNMKEIERLNELMVGRELKMAEMKKKMLSPSQEKNYE